VQDRGREWKGREKKEVTSEKEGTEKEKGGGDTVRESETDVMVSRRIFRKRM